MERTDIVRKFPACVHSRSSATATIGRSSLKWPAYYLKFSLSKSPKSQNLVFDKNRFVQVYRRRGKKSGSVRDADDVVRDADDAEVDELIVN